MSQREENRRNFPGVAAMVDELSAAFGRVRVLHAVEGGREIGKRQDFDGADVDRLIRMADDDAKRRMA